MAKDNYGGSCTNLQIVRDSLQREGIGCLAIEVREYWIRDEFRAFSRTVICLEYFLPRAAHAT